MLLFFAQEFLFSTTRVLQRPSTPTNAEVSVGKVRSFQFQCRGGFNTPRSGGALGGALGAASGAGYRPIGQREAEGTRGLPSPFAKIIWYSRRGGDWPGGLPGAAGRRAGRGRVAVSERQGRAGRQGLGGAPAGAPGPLSCWSGGVPFKKGLGQVVANCTAPVRGTRLARAGAGFGEVSGGVVLLGASRSADGIGGQQRNSSTSPVQCTPRSLGG